MRRNLRVTLGVVSHYRLGIGLLSALVAMMLLTQWGGEWRVTYAEGGTAPSPPPAADEPSPPGGGDDSETVPAPPSSPSPVSETQPLDASGGTVETGGGATTDGGVSVSFPPGVVDEPVAITVTVSSSLVPAPAPSGTIKLDKTLEITMSPPLALGKPVTVRINLTAEDIAKAGGDPGKVMVGRVEADGTITVLTTRVVDASQGIVEAVTDHFTKFALLAVTRTSPVQTEPADGALLNTMGPTLTWTNPAGTTQYQVQVIPFNLDGPGINLIRAAETSYTVKAPEFGSADPSYVMLPGMTYTWRVRTTTSQSAPATLTEADWSAWSVRSFRLPTVSSDSISAISPAPGGTVGSQTPTLIWSNTDQQVFYYEVQASKDPTFIADPAQATAAVYWNLVHGGVSTPPNSWTVPADFALEAQTTYYWRVRPRVQGDGTPVAWSDTWTFQTP